MLCQIFTTCTSAGPARPPAEPPALGLMAKCPRCCTGWGAAAASTFTPERLARRQGAGGCRAGAACSSERPAQGVRGCGPGNPGEPVRHAHRQPEHQDLMSQELNLQNL